MQSVITNEIIEDNILLISINRVEKKNAINTEMIHSLIEILNETGKNPDVGAIVLTGGQECFSAGRDKNDFKLFKDLPIIKKSEEYRLLKSFHRSFIECPVPIIAAVNGYSLGLGAGVVSWCDLAVMGQNVKYGFPEAEMAILPAISSIELKKWMPKKISFELFCCGSIISATEAKQLSLVNRVVSDEEVISEAMNFARKLTKNGATFSRFLKRYLNTLSADKGELVMEYSLEMMMVSGLISDEGII